MGALLKLPVVSAGQCMVKPEQVGLVTEISVAILLMQQLEGVSKHHCTCHAADLRLDHDQSRILIADCDGNLHVFPVLTSVLKTMREQGLLQESAEDIRHSKLQGVTLKSTEKGNARADMIRRIGIVEHR